MLTIVNRTDYIIIVNCGVNLRFTNEAAPAPAGIRNEGLTTNHLLGVIHGYPSHYHNLRNCG